MKEIKDPNETHKFNAKKCIEEVNKRIKKLKIKELNDFRFNKYHFDLFNKYFDIKSNDRYCYIHKVNAKPTYSYSIQTIDLIVDEIRKNPQNIIEDLKNKIKK